MAAGEIFEILAIPQLFHFLPGIYTKNDLPRNSRRKWQNVGDFFLASDSSRTLDSPKARKMGRVKRKPPGNGEPFILVGIGISSFSVFLGIGSTICRLGILQRCWWGWLVLVPGGCGYTEFKCGRRPFFLFRWMLRIGGTATKRPKKKPCLWGKKESASNTEGIFDGHKM